MKIGKEFSKIINKRYAPLSVIDIAFGRYDLTLKTNNEGDAALLFAGKRNTKGNIIGERFTHIITYDSNGEIIKDHWERKGKAS